MKDVFEKYWDSLVFDAYKKLLNYSLAEDCAQETMINYYLKIKGGAKFKNEKQLAKYLYVTNSHNASRLKYNMGLWQKGTLEIPIAIDKGDFIAPIVEKERGDYLNEALLNLPNHYVRPIISHYAYGVSYENIAKMIGSSSDSVRRYAKRGLKKLQEELEEKYND